jgi:rhodanese-related sulfurtransferase
MAPDLKLTHDATSKPAALTVFAEAGSLTPQELVDIVERFASRPEEWMERVRLSPDRRWYERLYCGPNHDVWVISWLPGQSTGFHDHGASSGAFVVAAGFLEEHPPGEQPHVVLAAKSRAFGPGYTHDVRNVSLAPAISIHAYSPPLAEMNRYELEAGRLVPRGDAPPQTERVKEDWRRQPGRLGAPSVELLLAAARARLQRLSPDEAHEAATTAKAVLVDIRPAAQRELEGEIAGALVVERNVLEWRFDPASEARLPVATDHDLQVIVFCSEGYTSSLAAASLQDLGLWRATDIIGGFRAWRDSGLETVFPVGSRNAKFEGPPA